MSDTPRTDAETNSHFNRNGPVAIWSDECVLSSFARTLEREIADLRDDIKRHVEIASFNAEDSLKWRNLYQNERDHMNAAQEEIERLKESLRLLQAQYCRVIDPLLEDDGETPKYKAENERLRGELTEKDVRHAAVMLHAQTHADEYNELTAKCAALEGDARRLDWFFTQAKNFLEISDRNTPQELRENIDRLMKSAIDAAMGEKK
jgi:hypothetical protein